MQALLRRQRVSGGRRLSAAPQNKVDKDRPLDQVCFNGA